MPLPVIAGALRTTVSGVVAGGGPWSNTWHILHTDESGWTLAEIEAAHDIFKDMYIGPNIGAGVYFIYACDTETQVDKFSYTPLDGSSGAYEFPVDVGGVEVLSSFPSQTCQVLTLRTALRGRQNRGRVYLPCWGASQYDTDGHIQTSARTSAIAQAVGTNGALSAAGAVLAVGSYGPYKNPLTGLLEAGTPHATPIISFTMDDRADVQRRRKS